MRSTISPKRSTRGAYGGLPHHQCANISAVASRGLVAACVVLAAAGYPDAPRKGDVIAGLPGEVAEDVHVFHAGTVAKDGQVVTAGGRVLCVTALGDKVKIAAERAYAVVDKLRFEGMQFRRDIGHRAFGRR